MEGLRAVDDFYAHDEKSDVEKLISSCEYTPKFYLKMRQFIKQLCSFYRSSRHKISIFHGVLSVAFSSPPFATIMFPLPSPPVPR